MVRVADVFNFGFLQCLLWHIATLCHRVLDFLRDDDSFYAFEAKLKRKCVYMSGCVWSILCLSLGLSRYISTVYEKNESHFILYECGGISNFRITYLANHAHFTWNISFYITIILFL